MHAEHLHRASAVTEAPKGKSQEAGPRHPSFKEDPEGCASLPFLGILSCKILLLEGHKSRAIAPTPVHPTY